MSQLVDLQQVKHQEGQNTAEEVGVDKVLAKDKRRKSLFGKSVIDSLCLEQNLDNCKNTLSKTLLIPNMPSTIG